MKTVGVFVGSLRKQSFNRKMARALAAIAPPSLSMQFVEIGNLPLYDQDLDDENRPAPEWVAFRDRVRSVNALLFVTPEYNRSIPGPLKNAIDVGSRPYGQSVWSKKPAGIVTVTPGALGGFGANHHLRQCCVFLDVPVLQQPEMYIGGAAKAFDAQGNVTDEKLRELMQRFMTAYAAWVEALT
jgi:chromate reductase